MSYLLRNYVSLGTPCFKCLLQRYSPAPSMTRRTFIRNFSLTAPAVRGYACLSNQKQFLSSQCNSDNNQKRWFNTDEVTHGVNVRPQKIVSRLAAEQLVRDMSEDERERVFNVLQDLEQELLLEEGMKPKRPSNAILGMLAFTNSIPFIGFGFFDNAIMILAGDYIDHTVGAAFGISTMAAAGIGNLISDVAGIGLAGYVEALATRLGLQDPTLTPLQLTMTASRVACHFGRAIGIVIGCIIGMAPLWFI